MKLPEGFAQIYTGIVQEGDIVQYQLDNHYEPASGLIGCNVEKHPEYSVYRQSNKEIVASLQKENAALKAELADIKAKWAEVHKRLSSLLEIV